MSSMPPAAGVRANRRAPEGDTVSLRVRQMRWEADGVVGVLLEAIDGGRLPPWTPGSHISLQLPGGLIRQYSLCGDLSDGAPWRIGVLREPASRGGSMAVHEQVRPGEVLTATGPRNTFTLRAASRYVFIAGGIGITPILAMVREATSAGLPWTLLYGGRRRSGMAFLPELEAIAQDGGRLLVHPQDEAGLLPLADVLTDPVPDTLVYCCGPEPLLAAVGSAMSHWPPESLVVERFAPVTTEPPDDGADQALPFEVEAAASGVTITVPPGTSIVEALEVAGVYPDTSCLEGICGTCETAVLDGIPEHRDSLLSQAERDAGATMMICVGRARSPRLVLDL